MIEILTIQRFAHFKGDEDEAGDFTGIAMNSYWTQEEILRGDFRELATGISDVCIQNQSRIFST